MSEAEQLARIAMLEEAVVGLTKQLAQQPPMKRTLRCGCGGTSILHFKRLSVAGHYGPYELALVSRRKLLGNVVSAGRLEAFACRACGRVEWYAVTLDDVEVDNETVIELDSNEPDHDVTPYR